ncbi:2OG-Fe(II) oxygenase [Leeia sp.]|uniref:2OG-Fe(II) oxygenase n=1 Tax=Leeia sp. TaxID=2884678 RepID=UPI0035B0B5CA
MTAEGMRLDLSQPDGLDRLVDALAGPGWVVTEGLLPPATVQQLRSSCLQAHAAGGFHLAGTGRASQFAVREGIRSDEVMWLDPATADAAQQAYLQRLESVRQAVNRALFMGLAEYECHFARYAAGAFYGRHLDAFQGQRSRVLSCVYYLNPDWQMDDGGALRLWLDSDEAGPYHDILPQAGTAVFFLAERFWHAVQPAQRERVSLTGWFRLRG